MEKLGKVFNVCASSLKNTLAILQILHIEGVEWWSQGTLKGREQEREKDWINHVSQQDT